MVPPLYMLYPMTPTLSVEAVQERLIWLLDIAVAESPVGTVGAWVSPALVTVTVAVAAGEVPPVPVQVIEYVAVAVGETDCVPLVALVPDQLPLAVQLVAFVDDQVNVELLPEVMLVGEAERVAVGMAGLATLKATVALEGSMLPAVS